MGNVIETDEDLLWSAGGILASWFLANPNGPTAYALGYIERNNVHDIFYRHMHFSGGRTWIIGSYENNLDMFHDDVGDVLFNSLILSHNHFSMTGSDRPPLIDFPSIFVGNGNEDVNDAIVNYLSFSLEKANWSQELFLLDRYRSAFFEKAGWQFRDAYERLHASGEVDEHRLDYMVGRYGHSAGWQGWARPDLPAVNVNPAVIRAWFNEISSLEYSTSGLKQFAQMWVGAVWDYAGGKKLADLMYDERSARFDQVRKFFDQYQMPLWPDYCSDQYICEQMGIETGHL